MALTGQENLGDYDLNELMDMKMEIARAVMRETVSDMDFWAKRFGEVKREIKRRVYGDKQ